MIMNFSIPSKKKCSTKRGFLTDHGRRNKKRRSTQLRPGTPCSMNFVGNKKAECPLQDTQIL